MEQNSHPGPCHCLSLWASFPLRDTEYLHKLSLLLECVFCFVLHFFPLFSGDAVHHLAMLPPQGQVLLAQLDQLQSRISLNMVIGQNSVHAT